jgi:uncharacterized membrane protein
MGPARQEIAELFFVLLFLILLKKEIAPLKRNVLLIIFGTGLVLSHYSLTYIFLLTILAAFLIFVFLDYSKRGRISISQVKIPLTFVIIFSTITFSWYIYTNGSAAVTPFIQAITTVTANLNQFFDPASRGTALQGLGVIQTPTIYTRISSVLFILTELLLVVGFIKLIISKKQSSKFSIEYKVFATLNLAIIAINLLLPGIADTFLMARFYQITIIILAPLAVMGGEAIFEFVLKNRFQKFYILALVFLVFIPLFMFQTQFVYEVTGDESYSLTLSMYRWTPVRLYGYTVSTQQVIGAQWIPQYANLSGIVVYSDYTSLSQVLQAYGLISGQYIYDLLGTTRITSSWVTYISDVVLINEGHLLNASLVSSIIENQNKIYSNGQCEIYEGSAP